MEADERMEGVRERLARYLSYVEPDQEYIEVPVSDLADAVEALTPTVSEERLRGRITELEKALRPFAEHGEALEGCEPSDQWCEAATPDGEYTHWLAVEHFHDAARALTTEPREEG